MYDFKSNFPKHHDVKIAIYTIKKVPKYYTQRAFIVKYLLHSRLMPCIVVFL